MKTALSKTDLVSLVKSVFSPGEEDRSLAILVDVPDHHARENPAWRERRAMAFDWARKMKSGLKALGLDAVDLVAYPNVHSNNADLPEKAFIIEEPPETMDARSLEKIGNPVSMQEVLAGHRLVLAPTEFSTTAPLKLLSQKLHFRAATMPGFTAAMIPALRLDYGEINRRVMFLKELLDKAEGLDIQFSADGEPYSIHFDLRFRKAHASGGRLPDPGTAGNLPSGEAYIVPYEGESGAASLSEGMLPVQFEEEIVLYRIVRNKAVEVKSSGPFSTMERKKIKDEPAYSNIAEIGFGVLSDFGIRPVGEVLLDEKLGLHIAFGRSDHFGGAVGVKDFSAPDRVVHIDRIYIPETQGRIHVDEVSALYGSGGEERIMRGGAYTVF